MIVIYFYHVPKCAGSYVTKLMRQLAKKTNGSYHNFYNRTTVIDPRETVEYHQFLESLPTEYSTDATVFVHHHHGYPGLKQVYSSLKEAKEGVLAADPANKFYIFTSVREVLGFITSRVNYLRNHCNGKLNFNKSFKIATNHNYQCKYLLYNHVNNWRQENDILDITQESIKEILSLVDKVYTPKDISSLIPDLSEILGLDIKSFWKDKKVNVSKKTFKMTPKDKKRLPKVNEMDILLLDYVNE
jgi:hypothetical protein